QAALGHPYHQKAPCPAIGAVVSCIDFKEFPISTPQPTPGQCIDFTSDLICPPPPPGLTPAPGSTVRVSVASEGTQANAESTGGNISGDGRFVVFTSEASNLVPGDNNNCPQTN